VAYRLFIPRVIALTLTALTVLVAVYIVFAHPSGSALRPTAGVTVVQSDAALGRRMAKLASLTLSRGPRSAPADSIVVDPHSDQGTFWGVGAAVTDSSAYLIHGLGAAQQTELLTELYGRTGLGLSFGAIPIGASDYSAFGRPYSLDDLAPGQVDPALMHFSVARDERWNLPVLQQIVHIQPAMHFFATTWSAPPWMKANDRFDDVGFTGMLLPQYEGTFAAYLVDWLAAYQARGINIAALAPENEPNSPSHVPAMDLPPAMEEQFIADDLAPALRASGLSTQIFGGDVGLRRTSEQAALIASSAGGDLGGLAWHCYSAPPTELRVTAALAPALRQIITECAEKLSKLPIAEDVLGALSNGAVAFSAWNLALTPSGGPVQMPNHGCPGCRGLVAINPSTHQSSLSPEAYVLGQVGRFVAPGSVRLTSTDEPTWYQHGKAFGLDSRRGILNVAYRNPDGQIALITYNAAASTRTVSVSSDGEHFDTTLPPGATTTFTWMPR
jgi:glucosylceramidase